MLRARDGAMGVQRGSSVRAGVGTVVHLFSRVRVCPEG